MTAAAVSGALPRVAALPRRGIALALDLLLLHTLPTLAVLGASATSIAPADVMEDITSDPFGATVTWGLLWLLWLAYMTLAERATGRTLGKWLLGLRVVTEAGADAGWKPTLIRNGMRVVDMQLFCLVGAVAARASKRNQRLGDVTGETLVVDVRHEGVATPRPDASGRPAPADVAFSAKEWAAVLALGAVVGLMLLNTTVLSAALPTLSREFDASLLDLHWIVNAYLIGMVLTLVAGGRLADMYGRRRLLIVGALLFALASVGAALSQSMVLLIASRGLKGVGAGLMLPAGIAIVGSLWNDLRERDPDTAKLKLTRAFSVVAAIAGIGLAVGPSIGGIFTAELNWRAIMWLNLALVAIVVIVGLSAIRESRDESAVRHIDFVGLLLLCVTVTPFAIGLAEAGAGNWPLIEALGVTALGIPALLLFVMVEKRVRYPLVDLHLLFGTRLFAMRSVSRLTASAVYAGALFLFGIHLENVLDVSPALVGLALAPLAAASLIGGYQADRLEHGVGDSKLWLSFVGLLAIAGAGVAIALSDTETSYIGLVIPMALLGVGIAIFSPVGIGSVLRNVGSGRAGLVTGSELMVSSLGKLLGVAVAAAVFVGVAQSDLRGNLSSSGIPTTEATSKHLEGDIASVRGHHQGGSVGSDHSEPVVRALRTTLVDGFRVAMVPLFLALALVLLIAFVVERRQPATRGPPKAAQPAVHQ